MLALAPGGFPCLHPSHFLLVAALCCPSGSNPFSVPAASGSSPGGPACLRRSLSSHLRAWETGLPSPHRPIFLWTGLAAYPPLHVCLLQVKFCCLQIKQAKGNKCFPTEKGQLQSLTFERPVRCSDRTVFALATRLSSLVNVLCL